MDIWNEQHTIGFTDVDPSGRMTLFSIFDRFQKAAILHAESLGVGRLPLATKGQVWIISRMSVLVERRPEIDEPVTLRTWPRGFEKLFALRDYDVRGAKDECLVRGCAGWLIIEIDKRRPLRPQNIGLTLPENSGLDALPGLPRGLAARENSVPAGSRAVAYSDIDYNAHVNNARYVQWIQDCVERETLESARSLRLDINYLSEALPREVMSFVRAEIPQTEDSGDGRAWQSALSLEGRKQSGDAAFRAELRLSSD